MFKGISKVEREHASALCKHLQIEKPDTNVGAEQALDTDEENMKEANRRERSAVKFYGQAIQESVEEDIKEFFKALVEIESDHIVLTDESK